ncbi:unnamed protein product [Mycena citricolor]|uniref:Uncharacterized protein n=1 Tax=Mycena citricolor TaxID=2018698 RepID=A0AAD2Q1C5_9AGAR|nr:unnamed protein product [Mycena citricolor]
MTEYTTSSQAIRDYLSSKERTRQWVQHRTDPPELCYSPSIVPSILDDPDFVPSTPSDAGSTHSLPPKMVLRYTDGRPDVPIPAPTLKRGGSKLRPTGTSRSHTIPHHDRPRTGSHAAPHVPEEIRILPAPDASIPPQPRSHARSKSLPRNAHAEPVPDMPIPGLPGPVPLSGRAPMVTFSQQPGPQWHPHSQGHRNAPPSIVYAPSHHRSHPHYAPPVIFSHPPKVGPDGVIYSHSAPVPANYGQSYHPTPYPSVGSDERHTAERHSRSRTPHPEASRSRHRHKEEMRPHVLCPSDWATEGARYPHAGY